MTLNLTSRVSEILSWLQAVAPNVELTADSRGIAGRDVFFAYPGELVDGRSYIDQAIARGAAAVVYEAENFQWKDSWRVPHLPVTGLKTKAGQIANRYYGAPDKDIFTVAVTGTNGKTSCTQWLGAALSNLGFPTAVVGTLGSGMYQDGVPGKFDSTGNTTPDAILLHRRLAEMRADGARALAIEASSIGLVQQRLSGMRVDVAVFTNLTRDHLDYHGDMLAYEAAKTILFESPGLQYAVLNLDDDMGRRLVQHLKRNAPATAIIGYSLLGNTADDVQVLAASEIRTTPMGTAFQLQSPFGDAQAKLRTIGRFNVSNVLAVLAVLLAKGIPFETALAAIEKLTAVPGRMQRLGGDEAPLVVIDYAHTPDALEKTLAALRPIAQERHGSLWCVFGCGGDRDPGKRPQMGKAALAADHIIITSDNPRSEDPAAIIAQIIEGIGDVADVNKEPQAIEDRAAAILWAIKHAGKTDVVLLAGKGHEPTQEIKGRKLPFLDADHAALALASRATMKGTH
ncbi:MAG: UDP-N-acetylmuramoyl-L-alanyl-D-glutamate--2,6-diaminopimelate ligase [Burkholderiales bacterium]|nr:UDP-N-acetylmuramoyl-L-alanyl-D-glutamate--2,6-diaminopimelate ligase [Burkholderiales bacterium]